MSVESVPGRYKIFSLNFLRTFRLKLVAELWKGISGREFYNHNKRSQRPFDP